MAKTTDFRLVVLLFTVLIRICSGRPTIAGCFSSTAPLVQQDPSSSQDIANCNDECVGTTNNQLVLAVRGTDCWCGNVLPSASSRVDSRFCDTPCPGDSDYICGGGTDYVAVWLTELGTEAGNIPNFNGASSTSTSSSSTSTSTTSTRTQTTNTSTGSQGNNAPTTTTSSSSSSSASPEATDGGEAAQNGENVKDSSKGHSDADVAIAVGVVIGVVALALLGFIFWWVWRRRRQTGSFARYRDSVDGSSAGLQSSSWKREPSPDSSRGPEMVAAGHNGPPIMLQRPTPGLGSPTDSVYSGSVGGSAAPAAVAAPVVAAPAALAVAGESTLRPPASREASRASSTTDPYYTPLEQPSISHLNQAELNALKAQTPHDSTSDSDFEEDSDTLSPLEDIRAPVPQRNNSRNVPYAYSSEYDFADGNTGSSPSPMMPGNMPGYFPVGRNSGGRTELP